MNSTTTITTKVRCWGENPTVILPPPNPPLYRRRRRRSQQQQYHRSYQIEQQQDVNESYCSSSGSCGCGSNSDTTSCSSRAMDQYLLDIMERPLLGSDCVVQQQTIPGGRKVSTKRRTTTTTTPTTNITGGERTTIESSAIIIGEKGTSITTRTSPLYLLPSTSRREEPTTNEYPYAEKGINDYNTYHSENNKSGNDNNQNNNDDDDDDDERRQSVSNTPVLHHYHPPFVSSITTIPVPMLLVNPLLAKGEDGRIESYYCCNDDDKDLLLQHQPSQQYDENENDMIQYDRRPTGSTTTMTSNTSITDTTTTNTAPQHTTSNNQIMLNSTIEIHQHPNNRIESPVTDSSTFSQPPSPPVRIRRVVDTNYSSLERTTAQRDSVVDSNPNSMIGTMIKKDTTKINRNNNKNRRQQQQQQHKKKQRDTSTTPTSSSKYFMENFDASDDTPLAAKYDGTNYYHSNHMNSHAHIMIEDDPDIEQIEIIQSSPPIQEVVVVLSRSYSSSSSDDETEVNCADSEMNQNGNDTNNQAEFIVQQWNQQMKHENKTIVGRDNLTIETEQHHTTLNIMGSPNDDNKNNNNISDKNRIRSCDDDGNNRVTTSTEQQTLSVFATMEEVAGVSDQIKGDSSFQTSIDKKAKAPRRKEQLEGPIIKSNPTDSSSIMSTVPQQSSLQKEPKITTGDIVEQQRQQTLSALDNDDVLPVVVVETADTDRQGATPSGQTTMQKQQRIQPPTPSTKISYNPLTSFSPSNAIRRTEQRRRREVMGLSIFSCLDSTTTTSTTTTRSQTTTMKETNHRRPKSNQIRTNRNESTKRNLINNNNNSNTPRKHRQVVQQQEQFHRPFVASITTTASFDSECIVEEMASRIRNDLFHTELLEIAFEAEKASEAGQETFAVIPSISYTQLKKKQPPSNKNDSASGLRIITDTVSPLTVHQNSNLNTDKLINSRIAIKEDLDDINSISDDDDDDTITNYDQHLSLCSTPTISNVFEKHFVIPTPTDFRTPVRVNQLGKRTRQQNDRHHTTSIVIPRMNSTGTKSQPSPSLLETRPKSSSMLRRHSTYSEGSTTCGEIVIGIPNQHDQKTKKSSKNKLIRRRNSLTNLITSGADLFYDNSPEKSNSVSTIIPISSKPEGGARRKIPVTDLRDINEVFPSFAELHKHVQVNLRRSNIPPNLLQRPTIKSTIDKQHDEETSIPTKQPTSAKELLLRPLSPLALLFSRRNERKLSPDAEKQKNSVDTPLIVPSLSSSSKVGRIISSNHQDLTLPVSEPLFFNTIRTCTTSEPKMAATTLPPPVTKVCGAMMLANSCNAVVQDATDTLCANQSVSGTRNSADGVASVTIPKLSSEGKEVVGNEPLSALPPLNNLNVDNESNRIDVVETTVNLHLRKCDNEEAEITFYGPDDESPTVPLANMFSMSTPVNKISESSKFVHTMANVWDVRETRPDPINCIESPNKMSSTCEGATKYPHLIVSEFVDCEPVKTSKKERTNNFTFDIGERIVEQTPPPKMTKPKSKRHRFQHTPKRFDETDVFAASEISSPFPVHNSWTHTAQPPKTPSVIIKQEQVAQAEFVRSNFAKLSPRKFFSCAVPSIGLSEDEDCQAQNTHCPSYSSSEEGNKKEENNDDKSSPFSHHQANKLTSQVRVLVDTCPVTENGRKQKILEGSNGLFDQDLHSVNKFESDEVSHDAFRYEGVVTKSPTGPRVRLHSARHHHIQPRALFDGDDDDEETESDDIKAKSDDENGKRGRCHGISALYSVATGTGKFKSFRRLPQNVNGNSTVSNMSSADIFLSRKGRDEKSDDGTTQRTDKLLKSSSTSNDFVTPSRLRSLRRNFRSHSSNRDKDGVGWDQSSQMLQSPANNSLIESPLISMDIQNAEFDLLNIQIPNLIAHDSKKDSFSLDNGSNCFSRDNGPNWIEGGGRIVMSDSLDKIRISNRMQFRSDDIPMLCSNTNGDELLLATTMEESRKPAILFKIRRRLDSKSTTVASTCQTSSFTQSFSGNAGQKNDAGRDSTFEDVNSVSMLHRAHRESNCKPTTCTSVNRDLGTHCKCSKTTQSETMVKSQKTNIDCGLFALSTSQSFLEEANNTEIVDIRENLPELYDGDEHNEKPLRRSSSTGTLADNTAWNQFVNRRRDDILSSCKSVIEIHDSTHNSIRAAVQMISSNISPGNRYRQEDSREVNLISPNHFINQPDPRPQENDEFLGNFLYCIKSRDAEKKSLEEGGFETDEKINVENTIVRTRTFSRGSESVQETSRFRCGSGLSNVDDFRKYYCCGASDNYVTILKKLRPKKKSTRSTPTPIPVNSKAKQNDLSTQLESVGSTTSVDHRCISFPRSTEHCDKPVIDPESWIDVATEKLDDLIDHVVGSRLGRSKKSVLIGPPCGERCSKYVIYQPPLLKKSLDAKL